MTKVAAERLRAQGQPIGDVYLDRQEIAVRVAELGTAIAETYAGRMPLLVAPLKSSAVFLADLSRHGGFDARALYADAQSLIAKYRKQ